MSNDFLRSQERAVRAESRADAGTRAATRAADRKPIASPRVASGFKGSEVADPTPGGSNLNSSRITSSWGATTAPDGLGAIVGAEQTVFTASGPQTAENLAGKGAFVALVHDPHLGRYAARRAWAIEAGEGPLLRVVADGDAFVVGAGAAFVRAHGGRLPCSALLPGQRLFACSTNKYSGDYVRVNLRDGRKGKELLHRLVASDVLGHDVNGRVVHHEDEDPRNNAPRNLRVLDQAKHAALHTRRLIEAGEHPFQLNVYPKAGEQNGMHKGGAFWSDPDKAKRYRKKKRQELLDRDPVALQALSTRKQALNLGHRIRGEGIDFRTMEEYIAAHRCMIGRINPKGSKEASLLRIFGSFEGFIQALDEENHRVDAVEPLGVGPRFAVVVSAAGGDPVWTPPVVLWPVGNVSPYGAGIVIQS